MKKRFLSLVLLFVFAVGLGVPAAAYEEEDAVQQLEIVSGEELRQLEGLEPVELKDCGVPLDPEWEFELESTMEAAPADLEAAQQDDAAGVSRARTPDLYIQSMYFNPMIYAQDINGNGALFVLLDLKWSYTYGASAGYSQFGIERLTSTEFYSILNRTLSYAKQLDQLNGMTVLFAGWRVGGVFHYAAQTPQYIEAEGDRACIDTKNPEKYNLSGTSGECNVYRNFLVPDENYEGYYSEVVRGGFYFVSDGKQLSAGLGATLVVNVDKH